MKPLIPKQHGAWAMLIIPFWLGVSAGQFRIGHIPMFIGWFFLYIGIYAVLMLIKGKKTNYFLKWTIIYLSAAIIFLIYPVINSVHLLLFALLFTPFFMISAYYSRKNKDRVLWNDLSAIAVFSLAGIAAYFYGTGMVDEHAAFIFITTYLFFTGCTFYVKTMIRERKNIRYKYISWFYHALILIIWAVIGEWWVFAAFLPSFIRAVGFYGRPLTIKQVGIFEIINAALFFILMIPAVR